jgi:hypothetical protein
MSTDDILASMKTKQSGSRAHQQLQKKLVKCMKNEHRMRINNANEYSVQLFKVFKNKLLNFL